MPMIWVHFTASSLMLVRFIGLIWLFKEEKRLALLERQTSEK
jgi:hypothetical protein